ncbi:MAG TPA: hypothetical protein VKN16_21410 [Methylomirabilota bacterium]|jgi:hypothetical protein|nr:hypothetical protein [Methylomirabilota bacterium]
MAAQAWKIYAAAKRHIGRGEITLHTGVFKMSLHRNSASGTITSLSAISIFSSVVAEISATGGYAAGGRALPAAFWTIGASATQLKFSYTTAGLIFTASGASLSNIRYALIRKSSGSTTSGLALCYCSLSSAAFTITSPNTLTILPAATGVFTMV